MYNFHWFLLLEKKWSSGILPSKRSCYHIHSFFPGEQPVLQKSSCFVSSAQFGATHKNAGSENYFVLYYWNKMLRIIAELHWSLSTLKQICFYLCIWQQQRVEHICASFKLAVMVLKVAVSLENKFGAQRSLWNQCGKLILVRWASEELGSAMAQLLLCAKKLCWQLLRCVYAVLCFLWCAVMDVSLGWIWVSNQSQPKDILLLGLLG